MASSADRSVTAGSRAIRLSVFFAGALAYASVMICLALAGAVVWLVWDLPRWAIVTMRRDSRRANAVIDGLVIVLWALLAWIVT